MIDNRLWQAARKSPSWLILTVLLTGLGGLMTIIQAYLLSLIVNAVFLEHKDISGVSYWLAWLLLVIAGRAACSWGRETAASRIAAQVQVDLRGRLLQQVFDLGPLHAYGEQTGELTAVLTDGIDNLEKYFSEYLPQLFIAILVPLIILLAVFPLDWISALILLVTAPLIPFFMILIGRYAEKLTQRQWGLLSRMSAYFLDVLQGLTTLKIFGQSKAQSKQIARISERYRQVTMGVLRVAFLSALVLELLATLSIAVIAVSIGLRLMIGGMSFSVALFILILAPEFYLPLRHLGQRFHAAQEGTAAANRIFGFLNTAITAEEVGGNQILLPQTIRFHDVSVSYQSGKRSALKDLALTMAPGKKVALVGPSGSGKSTIANLLLRFVGPNAGKITVGGQNLLDIAETNWRDQVAWVGQQPYLFPGSLAANIKLGRPEATMAQVIAAAKSAQLHDFIQTLPDKYETTVGERGARLSGGQAQRLALARAFLREASLIILDEPTSQLDWQTQAALQKVVHDQYAERMLLIIAHRLETVKQVDEIHLLDNGRIVESGSYHQLVSQNGPFASLLAAQREIVDWSNLAGSPTPETVKRQPLTVSSGQPAVVPQAQEPSLSSAAVIGRLLRFLRPSRGRIALSVLLGSLAVGSGVALMATSAYLISAAALQPDISALSVAIVGVRFFGLTRGVFRYLERLVSHDVTFKLLSRLRVWFYEKLEPLAPARLAGYASGDLLSRIVDDIDTLQDFYVRAVSPPLVAILVGGLMVLITGLFQPLLAGILLLFLLLGGIILPWLMRLLSRQSGMATRTLKSKQKELLVDIIQGLAELQVYNQTADWADKVTTNSGQLLRLQHKQGIIHGFQAGLSDLITFGAMWCILAAAIPLIVAGDMAGIFLAAAVLATIAVFEAVDPLQQAAQHLDESLAAASRLLAIIDSEPALKASAEPLPLPQQPAFQFHNTTFAYDAQADPAIYDVNFSLEPGSMKAITGPSGGGKTTLLNLLLRFWQWDEGAIRLNGRSLNDYDPDDIRACFSVVSQRAYLFNTTIMENLRLANPGATREIIIAATKKARLHDFVTTLPDGYDTVVGSLGRQISGGEGRRLNIAQAILKDAPVIILDEPTANLDLQTEKEVMATMLGLAADKTLLLITHRPVGLAQMDEIYRMEDGQLNMIGKKHEKA